MPSHLRSITLNALAWLLERWHGQYHATQHTMIALLVTVLLAGCIIVPPCYWFTMGPTVCKNWFQASEGEPMPESMEPRDEAQPERAR